MVKNNVTNIQYGPNFGIITDSEKKHIDLNKNTSSVFSGSQTIYAKKANEGNELFHKKLNNSKADDDFEYRPKKEFSQVISSKINSSPQRRNSLPIYDYKLAKLLPVSSASPEDMMYHITTVGNFKKIYNSGGLMPIAHQTESGRGLDEQRGDSFKSFADEIMLCSENLKATKANLEKNEIFPEDKNRITKTIDNYKKDRSNYFKGGINPEAIYMSTTNQNGCPESQMDYSYNREGTVLIRANIERKGSKFTQDPQGSSLDYRALGLIIPASHLEARLMEQGENELNDSDWKELDNKKVWKKPEELNKEIDEIEKQRTEKPKTEDLEIENFDYGKSASNLEDLKKMLIEESKTKV